MTLIDFFALVAMATYALTTWSVYHQFIHCWTGLYPVQWLRGKREAVWQPNAEGISIHKYCVRMVSNALWCSYSIALWKIPLFVGTTALMSGCFFGVVTMIYLPPRRTHNEVRLVWLSVVLSFALVGLGFYPATIERVLSASALPLISVFALMLPGQLHQIVMTIRSGAPGRQTIFEAAAASLSMLAQIPWAYLTDQTTIVIGAATIALAFGIQTVVLLRFPEKREEFARNSPIARRVRLLKAWFQTT